LAYAFGTGFFRKSKKTKKNDEIQILFSKKMW
jgi:hypothetical protein